jgi:DNA-binding transcriptional MerR regulator/effector-binding domain-containing protein
MFTIGEFSRVSGLTVKALRFYHEEGILVPSFVDPETAYRYYHDSQIEAARAIAFLRGLDFSVAEIKELLESGGSEKHFLDALERHKTALAEKAKQIKKTLKSLEQFIAQERQATAMTQPTYEIQEKVLDPIVVGGIRMQGRYSECGKGFAILGRSLGRQICGAPFLLHYDAEFHEDDAHFEACMPVRQRKDVQGIDVRTLPGGKCITLVHKGPYDQLGHSYAKLLKYVKERGYSVIMPTREVYLKGPGMIFRGNPQKYVTEIQMLVHGEGK